MKNMTAETIKELRGLHFIRTSDGDDHLVNDKGEELRYITRTIDGKMYLIDTYTGDKEVVKYPPLYMNDMWYIPEVTPCGLYDRGYDEVGLVLDGTLIVKWKGKYGVISVES